MDAMIFVSCSFSNEEVIESSIYLVNFDTVSAKNFLLQDVIFFVTHIQLMYLLLLLVVLLLQWL